MATLALTAAASPGLSAGAADQARQPRPPEPRTEPSERTELVGARTPFSKTFATADGGVYLTEVYPTQVHYPDPDTEEMVEVDTTLVAGPNGRLATAATPTRVSLAPDPRSEALAAVEDPITGATVSFGLLGAPATARAHLSGDTLRLEGTAAGVEVALEPTASGVKETLTLGGPRSPARFAYRLDAEGLVPRIGPDGSIALFGDDGTRSGLVIPRGFMADASGQVSDGVTYSLTPGPEGTWVLGVGLDRAWLGAQDRAWPVVVDPMLGALDSSDTTITEGITADRSAEPTLRVGFDGTAPNRALTYITGTIHNPDGSTSSIFNPLATDPEVLFAQMAFESHDCTADPADFELRALDGTWAPGTVTWANAPALGARIDTGATTQLMDATCVDGHIGWGYDLSAYIADAWGSAVAYNGIAMVATDEYVTPAVSLTAADPASPTTTGGIIQIFYRDAAAPDQPSAPVGLGPTGAVDTLTPTLTASYESLTAAAGFVLYLIRDDTATAIALAVGTAVVDPGELSNATVVEGVLEWDRTYTLEAWSVRSDNQGWLAILADVLADVDNASAKVTTTFTPSSLRLDQPPDGSTVFSSETLVATTAGSYSIDEVDFYLDDQLLGTDTDGTDGWSAGWDTTQSTDGAHTVHAVATDTDSIEHTSAFHAVTVDQTLDSPGRVEADFDAGRTTADRFIVDLGDALMRPAELPTRYQATNDLTEDATTRLLAAYSAQWADLSVAAKDGIRASHVPNLSSGPPDPSFATAHALDLDPGPEGTYPGCANSEIEFGEQVYQFGIWCTAEIPYGTATCGLADFDCAGTGTEVPDLRFFFSVGTDAEDVPDDPNSVLGDAVPQYVIDAANSMFLAFETYDGLGYQLGGDLGSEPLRVVVANARAYASPVCVSCHSLGSGDFGLVINPSDAFATPRHESFHIMQYNYLSEYDVLGELVPWNLGRDTTQWWMEATAEWAGHKTVQTQASITQGRNDYADRFWEFADDPDKKLTQFEQDERRQYGAFVLAEFLENEFGTGFILDTFLELDESDGRTGIEVVEDVIEAEGSTMAETLPRFWTAAYILQNSSGSIPDFDDPDVDDWRAELGAAESAGDSFSAVSRLGRANIGEADHEGKVIDVPAGGAMVQKTTDIKPGGAVVLDVRLEEGYRGDLQYYVNSNPGDRYDKYVVTFVAWSASTDPGSDGGYPTVCERGGNPVIETDPLPSSFGFLGSVYLDASCPTGSLIVTMHDANSTDDGDELFLHLSLDGAEPINFEETGIVDGPTLVNLPDGVGGVGFVSHPADAGPGVMGNLCIEVTAFGTKVDFFLDPVVQIEVYDPVSGAVLESVSGFGPGTLTNSGGGSIRWRTFALGGYRPTPWAPIAVRVEEDFHQVDYWNARGYSC